MKADFLNEADALQIGRALREGRCVRKRSIVAIANQLNLSAFTLKRIEDGKEPITSMQASELSVVYDCYALIETILFRRAMRGKTLTPPRKLKTYQVIPSDQTDKREQ